VAIGKLEAWDSLECVLPFIRRAAPLPAVTTGR
jgi:hypothetical protein